MKIDLRTFGQNSLKKSSSVSVGRLAAEKVGNSFGNIVNPGVLKQGDEFVLCKLPANIMVISAGLIIRSKATNSTATVQLAVGNKTLMNATAVGQTSDAVLGQLTNLTFLPTGGELVATIGAANLTDGVIDCFIEYYEVDKTFGEWTES